MDTPILAFLLLAILRVVFGDDVETTIVGPNIISKADWGAKTPNQPPELLTRNPPPFIIIHHSETPACTTQDDCKARVRSIQNHHMNVNGWNDLGYNFLVGEDGNVYEGRGWGIRGAHSPNYNKESIGICIIGSFGDHNPNAAAIQATQSLIAYGVSIGKIKKAYTLLGHCQTRATSCPGDSFYRLLQSWPGWSLIGRPNIISRGEWVAEAPKETPALMEIKPSPYVYIHHSDTLPCKTQANCEDRVRSIQHHHMNVSHWSDIGYNFLVGEDGNVYEGRGWGIRGAHTPSYNTNSPEICIIGSFDDHEPNEAAIKATQALIAYGVTIGDIHEDYKLLGHRQSKLNTICPGESLYKLIQTWPHYIPGFHYFGG